jgi:hypothetical protein
VLWYTCYGHHPGFTDDRAKVKKREQLLNNCYVQNIITYLL